MEIEDGNSPKFLDLSITRINSDFVFMINPKASIDIIIPFDSFQAF